MLLNRYHHYGVFYTGLCLITPLKCGAKTKSLRFFLFLASSNYCTSNRTIPLAPCRGCIFGISGRGCWVRARFLEYPVAIL